MRSRKVSLLLVSAACVVLVAAATAPLRAQGPPTGTPPEMVQTYESVADTILAADKAEDHLIRAILSTTRAHAMMEMDRARAAMKAGDAKGSQAAIEAVAAHVGQLASEGDNAVGAVRKRLIEGGHHHHADGEAKGIYDEGFVVVTRVAKQAFLESARAFGTMSKAPKAEALEAEWKKVQATYDSIMKAPK
jgi:hypothetical protein